MTFDPLARTFGWTMSGRPLNEDETARLLDDMAYRLVARTWLYRTPSEATVSTVFLVSNDLLEDPRPTTFPPMFETKIWIDRVVLPGSSPFGYHVRVMTLDESLATHARHVEQFRARGWRLALGGVDERPGRAR